MFPDKLAMAVSASEFNDKPEGDGGGAAQQSTPKMPKHRCLLVELLGSFLPRMSNEKIKGVKYVSSTVLAAWGVSWAR